MSEEIQELNTEVTEQSVETTQTDPYASLNEKFKTYAEDGTLDINSTLDKLNKSYTELEKKFSSRTLFSKEAEKKDLDLTDLDASFLENNKDLVELAKEAGLDTESFKKLSSLYDEKIKSVIDYKETVAYEDTITQLEEIWGKDTEVQVKYAFDAVTKLGFTEEELDSVGNNLTFIKLAAALGSQLGEHSPTITQGSNSSLRDLMTSEAYMNPKHPEHVQVKAQVTELYSKGYSLKG